MKVFPSFLHPLRPMWAQSRTFICPFVMLNLNLSFNFHARLDFNVTWFVKCIKIRKLKINSGIIEIISI